MKNLFILLASAALITGCASENKKIETTQAEEAKQRPAIDSPQDIVMEAATIFENSPDLTDVQKDQLHQIYTKVYDDSMAIRREIGQYKSLMYATLVKPGYKSSEIDSLTKKIVSLDKKRLDIMYKALKDVQKIVGTGNGKDKIYKQMGSIDPY